MAREVPDMGAQDDLACVGRVVERLFVVLVSFP